jgi:hypothetical protein
MQKACFQSFTYSPNDMFWGQLAGCLEQIDVGTTTILDHASGCYTNEHIDEAVRHTISSGLRAVWAYAEPSRIAKWDDI